jgi:hypothetical protein
MDQDREGLLLLLLKEGSTRHAVELYREETGATREEASRAVEELARRHGISRRGSRLVPILLAGLAGLLGAILAFQG